MNKKHLEKSFQRVSNLIREHRKAAKLTQRELSQLAGTGKTAIFDVEHGKTTVQMDTILKIFQALNIQMQFTSAYLDRKNEESSRS